jgi:hypothetical protein
MKNKCTQTDLRLKCRWRLSMVVETTNTMWQKLTRDVHFVILELANFDIVRLWQLRGKLD